MNIFDRWEMEVGLVERLAFIQAPSAPGGVVVVVGERNFGVVEVLDGVKVTA